MKVFIIGGKAYKELVGRIEKIERTLARDGVQPMPSDDDWVDGKTVCRYLCISPCTLLRLRANRSVPYATLGHKFYYTLGDIKRVLQERSVKRRKK